MHDVINMKVIRKGMFNSWTDGPKIIVCFIDHIHDIVLDREFYGKYDEQWVVQDVESASKLIGDKDPNNVVTFYVLASREQFRALKLEYPKKQFFLLC